MDQNIYTASAHASGVGSKGDMYIHVKQNFVASKALIPQNFTYTWPDL